MAVIVIFCLFKTVISIPGMRELKTEKEIFRNLWTNLHVVEMRETLCVPKKRWKKHHGSWPVYDIRCRVNQSLENCLKS